jgi:hypothetical protein
MHHKISTIHTLREAVGLDQKEHPVKELAGIFLNAMNDWPAMGQANIGDFVKELKEYFGDPLTKEAVNLKKHDMHTPHYWWKREAAGHITDLLKLSEVIYPEADFDTVLNKVLEHYDGEFKAGL